MIFIDTLCRTFIMYRNVCFMRRFKHMPEWVEESMFQRPKKGDPVFHLDPRGARTNALLAADRGDPAWACARGYRIAAQLAVEHIREKGLDQDFLIYPILFLYRHHVELLLKKLILTADESGVRIITGAQELSEPARKQLARGRRAHNLQWLWQKLHPVRRALEKHGLPREDIRGISHYIQQLNEVDPDSTSSRYTNALAKTKARLQRVQQNGHGAGIQNFAEAMERLANYLEGLDSYLHEMIDGYHQMLADSQD